MSVCDQVIRPVLTRTVLRRILPLVWLAALGCELEPVEIPVGVPVVVVHGVMRADEERQFIVVERSFTGEVDDVFLGYTVPTAGAPADPISGATVEVTNLDAADDTCDNPVRFTATAGDDAVEERPGVYWAPPGCPVLRPGDSLEMTVETPEGAVVTGSASVTGMRSASVTVLGETVPFGIDTVISFNRDRDNLRLHVVPIAGRLLQVAVHRVGELDMHAGQDISPGATISADTTSLTIPGDLVDVGGWSDGGDVFRAGREYLLATSVTDANYYDFSRSSNNDYTGKGFINRLEGGIGVFGSVAATSLSLRVTGEFDDEREGEYWLRGNLQGIAVDGVLTVYAVRSADETEVSALLTGEWLNLQPVGEGDLGWRPTPVERLLFEGTLDDDHLYVVALLPGPDGVKRIVLAGNRKADATFLLSVSDSMRIRNQPLGTVSVTQR